MRIRRDGRLEPFSHRPGVRLLLPGSSLEFELYPTRLICRDLSTAAARELERREIPVGGRVDQFTAQLDLERGRIRVWSSGAWGLFRYELRAAGSSYQMRVERPPQLRSETPLQAEEGERLSLGCHKQLDWEQVACRSDMAEIFPVWLRLGQLVPGEPFDGGPSLLAAAAGQRELAPWRALFRSSFSGLLAPRLEDADGWGERLLPLGEGWSGGPLPLLTEGARLIRLLFLQEEGRLTLLPLLPQPLHCGRYLQAKTSFGTVDFEWSKRRLRRAILRPKRGGELYLDLQKEIRLFRLQAGGESALHLADKPVTLTPGQPLYLDRFTT